MKKIIAFWEKFCIYIIAFCVPWIILLFVALFNDGWLSGNASILNGDTSVQLLPFAMELWEKIHSGESLSYTWNVVGGMPFLAILGYFFSPFTILLLIFPKNYMIDMIQVVMVLKWSCTGVSMVYFFYNTKYNTLRTHKKAVSLFLGVTFMLSSSNINFIRYIQFTDVTICFPILLLLIERLVDNKNWLLYCLILTFTIISNAYMAFEVCIFLVMWFFFQYDSDTEDKLKKFFIFACSSVLSALIASGLIIDGLVISGNRIRMNADYNATSEYAKSIIIGFTDFIQQLFIFSPINNPYRMEPNIYLSVIGVITVLFFIFIDIEKKKKIYLISVTLFMTLSFFVGSLSLIWHLFNVPNGVYHRFSNFYVFILLFLLMMVLIHLGDVLSKHVIVVGTISVIAFFYTFFSIDNYDSTIIYITTMFLIFVYILLFVVFCRKGISYDKMLLIIAVLGMM